MNNEREAVKKVFKAYPSTNSFARVAHQAIYKEDARIHDKAMRMSQVSNQIQKPEESKTNQAKPINLHQGELKPRRGRRL